jgi:single-stranded-DNA-specific exonuclease
MTAPRLVARDVPPRTAWALQQAGVPPLLARLFAGRGVTDAAELDDALERLLPPAGLRGATDAARVLADAIAQGRPMVVVADYDCDGATACAVAIRGLGLLGAAAGQVRPVVPDRAVHGYGLTPAIVDLARTAQPGVEVLITVDNGIASLEGVAHARALGLDVVVTDHHLPAAAPAGAPADAVPLPDATVIVNPNQPGCVFASKHIAGVGVMFYVLLALRAELRARGVLDPQRQPRLDTLLDLVALGTVADVVRLDANNRRLVSQGLRRVRAGRMQPGLAALFAVAGRDPARATAQDFGFAIGPRLNAAGRLADMSLGIACLLTDDPSQAAGHAARLDAINRERRQVEAGMTGQAEAALDRLLAGRAAGDWPAAVALFDPAFHEGVVGIVASRVKDRVHRPVFVFAPGQDGTLKGSGRSIPGFHLRDALDLVSKREPGLLRRFGGHAMAAGCTLEPEGFGRFEAAFGAAARDLLDASALQRTVWVDGPLPAEAFAPEVVRRLDDVVWGQAFEPPLFCDEVDVLSQREVGTGHLKLAVRHHGTTRDAIWFGRREPVPARVRLAYRLQLDAWNGQERVQMVVEAAEAA